MLWTLKQQFHPWDFEKESELESAIAEIQQDLFGDGRYYLDVKKLIGKPGKTQNIPDGYLIDLSSRTKPVLYLVEVELAEHDLLRHVVPQLVGFSQSFKSTPQKMKDILRNTLQKSPETITKFEQHATANGFSNIDLLLERMIYKEDAFNALIVIDHLEDEVESILSALKFPVETLLVERFRSPEGSVIYQFEPFLYELNERSATASVDLGNTPIIDPTEVDTIVVPAWEAGFQKTFIAEDRWHHIRIRSRMIPLIKYIAVYRKAPQSAITHVARVKNIERWKDTNKYVLNFVEPAKEIGPIKLVSKPNGTVKAPMAPRYTSYERLIKAKNLDEAF